MTYLMLSTLTLKTLKLNSMLMVL